MSIPSWIQQIRRPKTADEYAQMKSEAMLLHSSDIAADPIYSQITRPTNIDEYRQWQGKLNRERQMEVLRQQNAEANLLGSSAGTLGVGRQRTGEPIGTQTPFQSIKYYDAPNLKTGGVTNTHTLVDNQQAFAERDFTKADNSIVYQTLLRKQMQGLATPEEEAKLVQNISQVKDLDKIYQKNLYSADYKYSNKFKKVFDRFYRGNYTKDEDDPSFNVPDDVLPMYESFTDEQKKDLWKAVEDQKAIDVGKRQAFGDEMVRLGLLDSKDITKAYIKRVIDGDTYEVDIDGIRQTVRLLGGDAFETKDNERLREQAKAAGIDPEDAILKGKQSARQADALFKPGPYVILERDKNQPNFDDYNRILRHIKLPDGTNVGEKIYGVEGVSAKSAEQSVADIKANLLLPVTSTGIIKYGTNGVSTVDGRRLQDMYVATKTRAIQVTERNTREKNNFVQNWIKDFQDWIGLSRQDRFEYEQAGTTWLGHDKSHGIMNNGDSGLGDLIRTAGQATEFVAYTMLEHVLPFFNQTPIGMVEDMFSNPEAEQVALTEAADALYWMWGNAPSTVKKKDANGVPYLDGEYEFDVAEYLKNHRIRSRKVGDTDWENPKEWDLFSSSNTIVEHLLRNENLPISTDEIPIFGTAISFMESGYEGVTSGLENIAAAIGNDSTFGAHFSARTGEGKVALANLLSPYMNQMPEQGKELELDFPERWGWIAHLAGSMYGGSFKIAGLAVGGAIKGIGSLAKNGLSLSFLGEKANLAAKGFTLTKFVERHRRAEAFADKIMGYKLINAGTESAEMVSKATKNLSTLNKFARWASNRAQISTEAALVFATAAYLDKAGDVSDEELAAAARNGAIMRNVGDAGSWLLGKVARKFMDRRLARMSVESPEMRKYYQEIKGASAAGFMDDGLLKMAEMSVYRAGQTVAGPFQESFTLLFEEDGGEKFANYWGANGVDGAMAERIAGSMVQGWLFGRMPYTDRQGEMYSKKKLKGAIKDQLETLEIVGKILDGFGDKEITKIHKPALLEKAKETIEEVLAEKLSGEVGEMPENENIADLNDFVENGEKEIKAKEEGLPQTPADVDKSQDMSSVMPDIMAGIDEPRPEDQADADVDYLPEDDVENDIVGDEGDAEVNAEEDYADEDYVGDEDIENDYVQSPDEQLPIDAALEEAPEDNLTDPKNNYDAKDPGKSVEKLVQEKENVNKNPYDVQKENQKELNVFTKALNSIVDEAVRIFAEIEDKRSKRGVITSEVFRKHFMRNSEGDQIVLQEFEFNGITYEEGAVIDSVLAAEFVREITNISVGDTQALEDQKLQTVAKLKEKIKLNLMNLKSEAAKRMFDKFVKMEKTPAGQDISMLDVFLSREGEMISPESIMQGLGKAEYDAELEARIEEYDWDHPFSIEDAEQFSGMDTNVTPENPNDVFWSNHDGTVTISKGAVQAVMGGLAIMQAEKLGFNKNDLVFFSMPNIKGKRTAGFFVEQEGLVYINLDTMYGADPRATTTHEFMHAKLRKWLRGLDVAEIDRMYKEYSAILPDVATQAEELYSDYGTPEDIKRLVVEEMIATNEGWKTSKDLVTNLHDMILPLTIDTPLLKLNQDPFFSEKTGADADKVNADKKKNPLAADELSKYKATMSFINAAMNRHKELRAKGESLTDEELYELGELNIAMNSFVPLLHNFRDHRIDEAFDLTKSIFSKKAGYALNIPNLGNSENKAMSKKAYDMLSRQMTTTVDQQVENSLMAAFNIEKEPIDDPEDMNFKFEVDITEQYAARIGEASVLLDMNSDEFVEAVQTGKYSIGRYSAYESDALAKAEAKHFQVYSKPMTPEQKETQKKLLKSIYLSALNYAPAEYAEISFVNDRVMIKALQPGDPAGRGTTHQYQPAKYMVEPTNRKQTVRFWQSLASGNISPEGKQFFSALANSKHKFVAHSKSYTPLYDKFGRNYFESLANADADDTSKVFVYDKDGRMANNKLLRFKNYNYSKVTAADFAIALNDGVWPDGTPFDPNEVYVNDVTASGWRSEMYENPALWDSFVSNIDLNNDLLTFNVHGSNSMSMIQLSLPEMFGGIDDMGDNAFASKLFKGDIAKKLAAVEKDLLFYFLQSPKQSKPDEYILTKEEHGIEGQGDINIFSVANLEYDQNDAASFVLPESLETNPKAIALRTKVETKLNGNKKSNNRLAQQGLLDYIVPVNAKKLSSKPLSPQDLSFLKHKLLSMIDYAQLLALDPSADFTEAFTLEPMTDSKSNSQSGDQYSASFGKKIEKYIKTLVRGGMIPDAAVTATVFADDPTMFRNGKFAPEGLQFMIDSEGREQVGYRMWVLDPDELKKEYGDDHPIVRYFDKNKNDAGTFIINPKAAASVNKMLGNPENATIKSEGRLWNGNKNVLHIKHAEHILMTDKFNAVSDPDLLKFINALQKQGITAIVPTTALKMNGTGEYKQIQLETGFDGNNKPLTLALDSQGSIVGEVDGLTTKPFKIGEKPVKRLLFDKEGNANIPVSSGVGTVMVPVTGENGFKYMPAKKELHGQASSWTGKTVPFFDANSEIMTEGAWRALNNLASSLSDEYRETINSFTNLSNFLHSAMTTGQVSQDMSPEDYQTAKTLFRLKESLDKKLSNQNIFLESTDRLELLAAQRLRDVVSKHVDSEGKEIYMLNKNNLMRFLLEDNIIFSNSLDKRASFRPEYHAGVGTVFMNHLRSMADNAYMMRMPGKNMVLAPVVDPIGSFWRLIDFAVEQKEVPGVNNKNVVINLAKRIKSGKVDMRQADPEELALLRFLEENKYLIKDNGSFAIDGIDMEKNELKSKSPNMVISADFFNHHRGDKDEKNKILGRKVLSYVTPSDNMASVLPYRVMGLHHRGIMNRVSYAPDIWMDIQGKDNDIDTVSVATYGKHLSKIDFDNLYQALYDGRDKILKSKALTLSSRSHGKKLPAEYIPVQVPFGKKIVVPRSWKMNPDRVAQWVAEQNEFYNVDDFLMAYPETVFGGQIEKTMENGVEKNQISLGYFPLSPGYFKQSRQHTSNKTIGKAAAAANKISSFLSHHPKPMEISIPFYTPKAGNTAFRYENSELVYGVEHNPLKFTISKKDSRNAYHLAEGKEPAVDVFNYAGYDPDPKVMSAHMLIDGFASDKYTDAEREVMSDFLNDLLQLSASPLEALKRGKIDPNFHTYETFNVEASERSIVDTIKNNSLKQIAKLMSKNPNIRVRKVVKIKNPLPGKPFKTLENEQALFVLKKIFENDSAFLGYAKNTTYSFLSSTLNPDNTRAQSLNDRLEANMLLNMDKGDMYRLANARNMAMLNLQKIFQTMRRYPNAPAFTKYNSVILSKNSQKTWHGTGDTTWDNYANGFLSAMFDQAFGTHNGFDLPSNVFSELGLNYSHYLDDVAVRSLFSARLADATYKLPPKLMYATKENPYEKRMHYNKGRNSYIKHRDAIDLGTTVSPQFLLDTSTAPFRNWRMKIWKEEGNAQAGTDTRYMFDVLNNSNGTWVSIFSKPFSVKDFVEKDWNSPANSDLFWTNDSIRRRLAEFDDQLGDYKGQYDIFNTSGKMLKWILNNLAYDITESADGSKMFTNPLFVKKLSEADVPTFFAKSIANYAKNLQERLVLETIKTKHPETGEFIPAAPRLYWAHNSEDPHGFMKIPGLVDQVHFDPEDSRYTKSDATGNLNYMADVIAGDIIAKQKNMDRIVLAKIYDNWITALFNKSENEFKDFRTSRDAKQQEILTAYRDLQAAFKENVNSVVSKDSKDRVISAIDNSIIKNLNYAYKVPHVGVPLAFSEYGTAIMQHMTERNIVPTLSGATVHGMMKDLYTNVHKPHIYKAAFSVEFVDPVTKPRSFRESEPGIVVSNARALIGRATNDYTEGHKKLQRILSRHNLPMSAIEEGKAGDAIFEYLTDSYAEITGKTPYNKQKMKEYLDDLKSKGKLSQDEINEMMAMSLIQDMSEDNYQQYLQNRKDQDWGKKGLTTEFLFSLHDTARDLRTKKKALDLKQKVFQRILPWADDTSLALMANDPQIYTGNVIKATDKLLNLKDFQIGEDGTISLTDIGPNVGFALLALGKQADKWGTNFRSVVLPLAQKHIASAFAFDTYVQQDKQSMSNHAENMFKSDYFRSESVTPEMRSNILQAASHIGVNFRQVLGNDQLTVHPVTKSGALVYRMRLSMAGVPDPISIEITNFEDPSTNVQILDMARNIVDRNAKLLSETHPNLDYRQMQEAVAMTLKNKLMIAGPVNMNMRKMYATLKDLSHRLTAVGAFGEADYLNDQLTYVQQFINDSTLVANSDYYETAINFMPNRSMPKEMADIALDNFIDDIMRYQPKHIAELPKTVQRQFRQLFKMHGVQYGKNVPKSFSDALIELKQAIKMGAGIELPTTTVMPKLSSFSNRDFYLSFLPDQFGKVAGSLSLDTTHNFVDNLYKSFTKAYSFGSEAIYRAESLQQDAIGNTANDLVKQEMAQFYASMRNDNYIYTNLVDPLEYDKSFESATPMYVTTKSVDQEGNQKNNVIAGHYVETRDDGIVMLQGNQIALIPMAEITSMHTGVTPNYAKSKMYSSLSKLFGSGLMAGKAIEHGARIDLPDKLEGFSYNLGKAIEKTPSVLVNLQHLQVGKLIGSVGTAIAGIAALPFSPIASAALLTTSATLAGKAITKLALTLPAGNLISAARAAINYYGFGVIPKVLDTYKKGINSKDSSGMSFLSDYMDEHSGQNLYGKPMTVLGNAKRARQRVKALKALTDVMKYEKDFEQGILSQADVDKVVKLSKDIAGFKLSPNELFAAIKKNYITGKDGEILNEEGFDLAHAIALKRQAYADIITSVGGLASLVATTETTSRKIAEAFAKEIRVDVAPSANPNDFQEKAIIDMLSNLSVGQYGKLTRIGDDNNPMARMAKLYGRFQKKNFLRYTKDIWSNIDKESLYKEMVRQNPEVFGEHVNGEYMPKYGREAASAISFGMAQGIAGAGAVAGLVWLLQALNVSFADEIEETFGAMALDKGGSNQQDLSNAYTAATRFVINNGLYAAGILLAEQEELVDRINRGDIPPDEFVTVARNYARSGSDLMYSTGTGRSVSAAFGTMVNLGLNVFSYVKHNSQETDKGYVAALDDATRYQIGDFVDNMVGAVPIVNILSADLGDIYAGTAINYNEGLKKQYTEMGQPIPKELKEMPKYSRDFKAKAIGTPLSYAQPIPEATKKKTTAKIKKKKKRRDEIEAKKKRLENN